MKNCFKAALLFGALFFIGVDAKATTTDEATAWVDNWTTQMEIAAESIGVDDAMCGGKNVQALLDLFIQKFKENLPKNLSQGDRLRLSEVSIFAQSVIDKKRECLQKKLDAIKILHNNT